MRKVSIATLLVLALSVFFATATRASEQTSERPAITRLVLRDRTIVISSGSDGLVYSVSTPDGTVVDANLSEEQLQAKYPDVYDNIRPAIAGSEESENVTPWAGM